MTTMEKASLPVPYLQLSKAGSQETLAEYEDTELDDSCDTLYDAGYVEDNKEMKAMHILQNPSKTRLRLLKRSFWLFSGCLVVVIVR